MIPTDDPHLYWDNDKQECRTILSLRHVGYLANVGKLGRNNLLINKDYGSMIQIWALLTDTRFESDPLADYEVCPPNCWICLDICPQKALTGETVIQKNCRPLSNFKTEKDYMIKKCFECRKRCPRVLGIKTKYKLRRHNTQYSKLGLNGLRQLFVSKLALSTVDKMCSNIPNLPYCKTCVS